MSVSEAIIRLNPSWVLRSTLQDTRQSCQKLNLSSTMQKLCLSTKFPRQEIRWNYGIFQSLAHLNKISVSETSVSSELEDVLLGYLLLTLKRVLPSERHLRRPKHIFITSCLYESLGTIFISVKITAQNMKFSIKDFFSKFDQIRSLLQIWSHLLKKSLTKNVMCSGHDTRLFPNSFIVILIIVINIFVICTLLIYH